MILAAGGQHVRISVARMIRSLNSFSANLNTNNHSSDSPMTARPIKSQTPKQDVNTKPPDPSKGGENGQGYKNPKDEKGFSVLGVFFKTIWASAVIYGGTIYAATKNDKVMDFVIDNQLPFYEELIDLIEHGFMLDLKSDWTSSMGNTKHKFEKLTNDMEKKGEKLLEKTKKKVSKAKATDVLPAEQLQEKVEFESVRKKPKEKLPLVAVYRKGSSFVDESVQKTIDSFNKMIIMIDASDLGEQKKAIVNEINENVSVLSAKLDAYENSFVQELEAKWKLSETKLLSRYTQKELDLTQNMLDQYKLEKAQLEKAYNTRLKKEIELTKNVISQAAVNATTMVRIEQTKRFEAMIQDRIDQERSGRLKDLRALENRVQDLESLALSVSSQVQDNVSRSLVQNVLADLKWLLYSVTPETPVRGFNSYTEKLVDVTSDTTDELLKVSSSQLRRLLCDESNQSILTNAELLSSWKQLAPELRSASLLPPNAGILGHILSIFFSKFLLPVEGLNPNGKDIESVIGRVSQSLVRGDLDIAVEEVSSLKGWTRRLANDWVKEGRKRLEAEFLLDVVEAEAKIM